MGVSDAEEVFQAEYAADPRLVHQVRETVQRLIADRVKSADELEEVKVAVSEAFSNAVCHGSPNGRGNRIGVRCLMSAEQLIVEITDQGGGFQPREIALPDFEEWKPSGRGLFLIQALMDNVQFEPAPGGTCVRMTKQLLPLEVEPQRKVQQTSRSSSGSRGGASFASAAALMQEPA